MGLCRPSFFGDLWPQAGPDTPGAVPSSPRWEGWAPLLPRLHHGSSSPSAHLSWPGTRCELSPLTTRSLLWPQMQALALTLTRQTVRAGGHFRRLSTDHLLFRPHTSTYQAPGLAKPPPQPQSSAFPPPAHTPWHGSGLLRAAGTPPLTAHSTGSIRQGIKELCHGQPTTPQVNALTRTTAWEGPLLTWPRTGPLSSSSQD